MNLETSADVFIRRLSWNLQCGTVVYGPKVKECLCPKRENNGRN
jgi:hypothetical protein